MKCIIIDDEATARAIIAQLCAQVNGLEVIGEFESAIEGLKFINQQSVDVVFLDIHMPTFTGIDFMQTIKSTAKIVLTTSDTDFAIEAYGYEAVVDYLVKPISGERFVRTLRKITNTIANTAPSVDKVATEPITGNDLYVNIDHRLIKLKLDEILLVEAKGDYINIKTANKVYYVHTTLKKIKDKLPDAYFVQIHRSYIINFTKIIDIEDNSVLIEKSVVPISRANRNELMNRLNLL